MCELCPVVGGAMKATNCGKWCHMICARWCPDPIGLNGGLLEGLSEVPTSALVLTYEPNIRHLAKDPRQDLCIEEHRCWTLC